MTQKKTLAALALLAAAAPAHAQEMRPGLWEFNTVFSLPGKAPGAQKMTRKQCLTPNDVKDKSAMKGSLDPKLGCSMSDFKQDGSQFSYKVACKGQATMTGTVSGTATADAMSMNMDMDMSAMKGMGTMKQSVSARRIGDCK
jgi:hypothetical protein